MSLFSQLPAITQAFVVISATPALLGWDRGTQIGYKMDSDERDVRVKEGTSIVAPIPGTLRVLSLGWAGFLVGAAWPITYPSSYVYSYMTGNPVPIVDGYPKRY